MPSLNVVFTKEEGYGAQRGALFVIFSLQASARLRGLPVSPLLVAELVPAVYDSCHPAPVIHTVTEDVAKAKGLSQLKLSGTKFRQMLRAGEEIPEWFAFKSVVKVLREEAQAAAK